MLSGDNSILSRTTDAKERTERAEIIETAQMDILGKQAQNHGSLSEEELTEILTSPDYNTKGTLSDNGEESVLQKTLTSSDGKYQILVSDIYNGSLTGANSGGTLSLEALKTKISKESSDCMIDENGKIMPINVWSYQITGEDTCKIICEWEGEYGSEYGCAYVGEVLENGELQYNIPVFIKVEDKAYKVISLAENSLGNIGVKKISIPNNIEKIEDKILINCSNLEELIIGENVSSIGEQILKNCNKLSRISVDENNKKYDSRNNCNAIINTENNVLIAGCKNSIIPNNVLKIGPYAFEDCVELDNIVIPNSVTEIGSLAFWNCTGLTNVTNSNNLTTIFSYAFSNCEMLENISIPSTVTRIESGAFNHCKSLKNIEIPEGVTSIQQHTFSNCISLKSVTIPSSVNSIYEYSFDYCEGLDNLVIPNSVTYIRYSSFRNVPHIYYHGSATGKPWGALAIN